ncbi:MAG TPA: Uma2 family endonuclease [Rubrobacter sp.]|nr:Uma2 family endonuclease [Rubrobacter sp.]
MTVRQSPVTAEELLRTPDDGLRRELVRGEVRTMAPAGNVHGRIAMNLAWSLTGHVKSQDLGVVFAAETGFKISSDPDTVRAPDTAFVRRERVEAVGDVEGYWPGAPDLAVEVVSPNDRFSEVEEKVTDWLAADTRMVIVADPPGKTLTVRRSEKEALILSEGETLEGGEVVPGWTLPVADVFR